MISLTGIAAALARSYHIRRIAAEEERKREEEKRARQAMIDAEWRAELQRRAEAEADRDGSRAREREERERIKEEQRLQEMTAMLMRPASRR